MSVVASVEHLIPEGSRETPPSWVLTKGAPEMVARHLEEVPKWYKDTYLYYARQGKRVIATAYKEVSTQR